MYPKVEREDLSLYGLFAVLGLTFGVYKLHALEKMLAHTAGQSVIVLKAICHQARIRCDF